MNVERTGHRPVAAYAIAETGTVVWLKDYGLIRVFRILAPHGETKHWATNDLGTGEWARLKYADLSWSIEVYHRTLKGGCHVEHAMVRAGRAQPYPLGDPGVCPFRAASVRTGVSWYRAKQAIIRPAIRAYLAHPWPAFSPSA